MRCVIHKFQTRWQTTLSVVCSRPKIKLTHAHTTHTVTYWLTVVEVWDPSPMKRVATTAIPEIVNIVSTSEFALCVS